MKISEPARGFRSDRLSGLGSSIFAEVAAWKEEARRLGQDIIDLGIGSPDRGPSLGIRQTLGKAVLREDAYSYPSSQGSLAFRRQAAAWMDYRFGVTVDPGSEVLALMGSQDGLAHLALAVCNSGDLAIVPDPGYPIYTGSLAVAGVVPWLLPLEEANGFLPDLEAVPEEIWAKARFILVNFPGNPIAAEADLGFFERLLALARRWNVLVVHDLAYSEMGFDGYRPPSILQIPGAHENAVEFHSFSKSFNMAGCRIGFLAGNREAVGALRELKSNLDYGVFEPVQEAAVYALQEAMKAGKSDRGVAPVYEARRNAFTAALADQGWPVPLPKATMFVWAPLPAGCTQSSRAFARELLLQTGVAVIPGDAFGARGEGYLWIALVEEEGRLLEAAERIGAFIRQSC